MIPGMANALQVAYEHQKAAREKIEAALAQSREECERLKQEAKALNVEYLWQKRHRAAADAECERLKAQLDRAVAALKECVAMMRIQEKRSAGEFHLSAEAFVPMWLASLSAADAFLASPSQPEPVKAHAFEPYPAVDGGVLCDGCGNPDGPPWHIIPENAGTTCPACQGRGGFDKYGSPAAPPYDTEHVCGICGGSGVTK